MIYLDSSALLKLLFEESESAALASWIAERADTPMVSSELVSVEVVRATRRLDTAVVPAARALVSQLDLIPLNGGLIEEATDAGEPILRTLDAIHLASALSICSELTAFVAYDNRLLTAAQDAGIEPTSPAAG
ncbi:MAG: type II toxin-antitoxin system VapC family toxin [Actinomycetota bacterium]|nr:type II toxin-antitoxin system VapC family toxin [Actinomycetota bacterium]